MNYSQLEKLNPVSLGKRCKARRESLGMTREQLAEKINLSPNFIGQFESGNKLLSISNFYLLCQALSVSPNELLKIPSAYYIPNGESSLSENLEYDKTKLIVKNLFELILKLSPDEKVLVENLINEYELKSSK